MTVLVCTFSWHLLQLMSELWNPTLGNSHLILAEVWVRLELTTRKEKASPLSAVMASSSVTSSPA